MAPWTSAVAYSQGEKFSAKHTTNVKLGRYHWIGTWTGAGVTFTLAFLVAAHDSMEIGSLRVSRQL